MEARLPRQVSSGKRARDLFRRPVVESARLPLSQVGEALGKRAGVRRAELVVHTNHTGLLPKWTGFDKLNHREAQPRQVSFE